MASQNLNRVCITGNLTRDPELRTLASGMTVCKLGVAVNGRRKEAGEWVDAPNFFDVTVWGAQGENAARYLIKGRPVAIDGRLEWSQWEKDGQKRSKVEIVAESVQFLNGRDDDSTMPAARAEVQIDDNFPPAATVPADDEIPF